MVACRSSIGAMTREVMRVKRQPDEAPDLHSIQPRDQSATPFDGYGKLETRFFFIK